MGELWISTAVLTVIVLLLRRIFRGKVPYRYLYGLWLLVVLRLCVPVSIGNSPLSLSTLLNQMTPGISQEEGSTVTVQKAVTVPTDAPVIVKQKVVEADQKQRPEKIKTILRHRWLKVLAEKPWICRWNGCLCWSGWLALWPWPLYC